jgi:hypothetical protein
MRLVSCAVGGVLAENKKERPATLGRIVKNMHRTPKGNFIKVFVSNQTFTWHRNVSWAFGKMTGLFWLILYKNCPGNGSESCH